VEVIPDLFRTDRVPPVLHENHSGQKFLVRKLKITKKVGAKIFWPGFFRIEISKIQKFSGRKFKQPIVFGRES